MSPKSRREVLRAGSIIGTVSGLSVIAGCAGGANGEYPSDTINFVVPFAAGGGTDTYARTFEEPVADELGTDIQILNEEGGGQWVGLSRVVRNGEDGYTIATAAVPGPIISAIRNPPEVDTDSLELACSFAQDKQFVVANPELDQYENDLEALFEDVQSGENQQIAVPEGQDPRVSATILDQEHGIPFEPVGYSGSAGVTTAVASGETPVGIASDTGSTDVVQAGDVLPVGTLAPERSNLFPDAPSVVADLGYDPLAGGAIGEIGRPVIVHKDIAQERKDTIEAAFKTAVNSNAVQNWADETNSPVNFIPSEEANQTWEAGWEELPKYVE